jgi:phosphatidylglycerol:prolipoprotein diacylglycerol transferase
MLPHLFSLGGHPVSTYGVMLSLAHLAGIALILRRAKARGLPVDPYIDLIFVILLAGVVGGRAWYIAEFPQEFSSPLEWIYFWKGGLSFFGGLLGAFLAFLGLQVKRRLPIWETADFFAPVLPLSLGLVRLGCFCAGCCYGHPTELPWGTTSPLAPLTATPLHPTQLYEASFLFLLSGLLFWVEDRGRFKPGMVATSLMLAYGLYRLLTNPLRGDIQPWIGAWSANDLGAATLCVFSLASFAYLLSRKKYGNGAGALPPAG